MVFFRHMSFFVLALAGCGVSPGFEEDFSHGHAPIVVYADDWEPPAASTEANVLTRRILQRSGTDFRLYAPQSRELAREIERILSRIRSIHPMIKDVTARDSFDPWSLILHLERDLYRKVSRAVPLVSLSSGPFPLRTGHEKFDTLNMEHGLAAIELFPHFSIAVFHFNQPIDPFLSRVVYSSIEGVEAVELDALLVDGPDLEASKSQGIWYVVFRKAWGDCPSGCIFRELYFFTVEDDEVERIGSVEAMDMPRFADLVELRGWP